MAEFIRKYRKYLMVVALMFVFVSLSGTTYSLFVNTNTTNTFNYNTGMLDLEFTEDEKIVLSSVFPKIDSDAIKEEPYELTIKNTGSLTYLFDLKMLSDTSYQVIDSKYIKYKINDSNPTTLYKTNNIIAKNVILNPSESITFKINIWLDYYTPNLELGKEFVAKLVTSGSSIYKTLDNSGANYPDIKAGMIPVYYNEDSNKFAKADSSNTINYYEWYNYNNQKWANTVVIKDSEKKIYDITGNHNINISEVDYNNENIMISSKYLDLGIDNYNNTFSGIFRIRFENLEDGKYYLLSNDKFSYYYNSEIKKFVFKVGNQEVSSGSMFMESSKWYIVGFTYDGNKVNLYADGIKMNSLNIYGSISSNETLKVGNGNSNNISVTIGDIYLYRDMLTEEEISTNYKDNISIIRDNLIAGYNMFIPMNRYEYYMNSSLGTMINSQDIDMQYVWIPRFKYKLFNVTGEDIDSYDAKNKGIEIVFEKGIEKTGLINCKDNICYTDELLITRVTSKDNNKFYTHPAFTIDKELKGIWISKYEYDKSNNIENLYNDITKNNKHIIKNTEWGALTYLSHSKYGVCKDNTCSNFNIDSTTNNKYGIMDTNSGKIEINLSGYNISNFKMYEYDNYIKNNFILGDATKEISSWYQDESNFIDTTNNYFVRGGVNNINNRNMFYYNGTIGIFNDNITTRIVIR